MSTKHHKLPNGLEVLTLSSASPDDSKYAAKMVARAHLMLPDYADGWGEELTHWKERIATGGVAEEIPGRKGEKYYLPELNITIVGTHLDDPLRADIKGFGYGEYHAKSKTAHIPYYADLATGKYSDSAVIQAIRDSQIEALSKNGRDLKAVFEELPDGEKPLFQRSGHTVNFKQYATAPWYDYGSDTIDSKAPLQDFKLHVSSPKGEKIDPKTVEAFLEDHHQYNSSKSFGENVVNFPNQLRGVNSDLAAMKEGTRDVLSAPVQRAAVAR